MRDGDSLTPDELDLGGCLAFDLLDRDLPAQCPPCGSGWSEGSDPRVDQVRTTADGSHDRPLAPVPDELKVHAVRKLRV